MRRAHNGNRIRKPTRCYSHNVVDAILAEIRRSATAAEMGWPVVASKYVKPGEGLTSRQYHLPSGVRRKSIPASERPRPLTRYRQRSAKSEGSSTGAIATSPFTREA